MESIKLTDDTAARPRRLRVELFPPEATEAAASMWVDVSTHHGQVTLVPQHDCQDLGVAPGWHAISNGQDFIIQVVDGERWVSAEVPTHA